VQALHDLVILQKSSEVYDNDQTVTWAQGMTAYKLATNVHKCVMYIPVKEGAMQTRMTGGSCVYRCKWAPS
jgi:hypothetical protein